MTKLKDNVNDNEGIYEEFKKAGHAKCKTNLRVEEGT